MESQITYRAKNCIQSRVEEIKQNDKDDWNIAYGMISLASQLGLITDAERKQFIKKADHAYFWGKTDEEVR